MQTVAYASGLQRHSGAIAGVGAPSLAALTGASISVGEIAAVAAVPIVFASELADFVPLVDVQRSVVLALKPREVGLVAEPREVLLIGGLRETALS